MREGFAAVRRLNLQYRIGIAVNADCVFHLTRIRHIGDEIVATNYLEVVQSLDRGLTRLFANNLLGSRHSRFDPVFMNVEQHQANKGDKAHSADPRRNKCDPRMQQYTTL